jgi:anti-anti-sigma factor
VRQQLQPQANRDPLPPGRCIQGFGPLPNPEQLDPYGHLRCRVAHLDGRLELHLTGELDVASADHLRWRVLELAGLARGDVILDLGDLEFMGSCGLRSLLQLHDGLDSEQRRLVLRNVRPAPRRVIEVTGADKILHIE